MNTLFLFILLLFNLDIMTQLILFIMINSISLIIGAGQIIGTFLYPRLDWENFEDIGLSKLNNNKMNKNNVFIKIRITDKCNKDFPAINLKIEAPELL